MGFFKMSRRKMVAPDTVVNVSHSSSKYGIVIGSFGMPGMIELSIATARKTCGNVPILIADDHTPCSMGQPRLMEIPKKWSNVGLIINGENLGHAPGDVRAFRNGLRWAKNHGIEYLCKLSQRFMFLNDNWLQDFSEIMRRNNAAVSGQRAVHLHMGFAMRTECVFMDVNRCTDSPHFMSRVDPPNGKIHTSAEDWIAAAINESGFGPFFRCHLLPVDRFEKKPHILWHNSDSTDDYNETENAYTKLAKEMGIDLGPEFSGAGWHIIANHRPEAGYHML